VLGVTAAQRGEKRRHVLLARLVKSSHPLNGELVQIAGQVAPVRRQCVARKAPLYREVIEVGLDGAEQVTRRLDV
jgi:hypothetical protein